MILEEHKNLAIMTPAGGTGKNNAPILLTGTFTKLQKSRKDNLILFFKNKFQSLIIKPIPKIMLLKLTVFCRFWLLCAGILSRLANKNFADKFAQILPVCF